ncbi:hypothetical protein COY87_05285 [Candidatus Roizmanbacteria bacterium CG_4_10_14_0_8_um_filter_33_9]|uniref:SCP domain-containing protein n=1 Tax=Candidatus Roizmanbacteria bacterium CG_4_10_14_0_8_um_filter_33_9 TaxID=1974826 RepID=A0A2M7QGZ6_9BACT|nr:MAG: hypothetical protein COY87_05285 [Candidatus Roizmanbacteria bacterium CG_4_10_14_0_8_um_filter_33_9]
MNKFQRFLHHLFVPSYRNNYKSKALHTDFLAYYLIFALLLMITVKNIRSNYPNVLGFATDITSNKLLELTNNERTKANLNPLILNNNLTEAAEKKAKDMFNKNYWSHFGPNGETPWDFILGTGYQYEYAGENLAKNFLFSQGVVDAWMKSPTHRENLLRKEYANIGFAVVNGVLNGEETTLIVQMFGTPATGLNQSLNQKINPLTQNKNDSITLSGNDMQNILGNSEKRSVINIFSFSIEATYFFLIFFALVLMIDFVIASKLHIIRISGKNIAHLVFIGFILIAIVFILKVGAIL